MWVYDIVTRNLVNQWYDWKIKPTNYIKLLDKSLGFSSFHYFSFGFIIFLLLAWLANCVVSIATSIDHLNNESHSNSPAVQSLMLTTQLLFSLSSVACYLHDWLILSKYLSCLLIISRSDNSRHLNFSVPADSHWNKDKKQIFFFNTRNIIS